MRIKTILSILPLMALLTGCIYDDLSGCPPTESTVRIHLSYEQDDVAQSALPVNRIDLYLFDANHRFVGSITDAIGPFNPDRSYQMTVAPGDYTVVAWGNQVSPYQLSPATLVPGQTTLEEISLRMEALSTGNIVPIKPVLPNATSAMRATTRENTAPVVVPSVANPLYYGTRSAIRVMGGQTADVLVPLIRDTKQINLSVRFERADGTPCPDAGHACNPTIRSSDGIFNFENSLPYCPAFFYKAASRNNITGGYDAVFHKARLLLNEPSEIVLARDGAVDASGVFYRESLMKWLRGTNYDTQEKIDRTHVYNILLRFIDPNEDDTTHATLRIFVNGWEYVEMNDGV